MMFFKSVADLCFTGPFAVLGKPITNINHSVPVDTTKHVITCSAVRARTNGQMYGRYQTYYLPCFAVDNNCLLIVNNGKERKFRK